MKRVPAKLLPFLLLGGMMVSSDPLSAATRSWIEPVDGDFSDPTRWSNSLVPGAADLASFSSGLADEAEYTVTLSESITTANMYVGYQKDGDRLTLNFDLNGFNYNSTNTTNNGGVTIARNPDSVVTMKIIGAGIFNASRLDVAYTVGRTGTLNLSDSATSLVIDTGSVGFGGVGTMTVSSGASFTSAGLFQIGRSAGGNGTFTLTGSGTSWTADAIEVAWFSASSTGSLTVSDGAEVNSSGSLSVGSQGTLLIDGGKVSLASSLSTKQGATLSFVLGDVSEAALVHVAGNLTLASSTEIMLSLDQEANIALGDTHTLIRYNGYLAGGFNGLQEGDRFSDEERVFQFSYGSGYNDAIKLTAIIVPATRHVSVNGADNNSGSAGSPWATLSHALSMANPGDTIILGPGVHQGAITIDENSSGIEGYPITIEGSLAVNGELLSRIDGSEVINPSTWIPSFGVGPNVYRNDSLSIEPGLLTIDGESIPHAHRVGAQTPSEYRISGGAMTILASNNNFVVDLPQGTNKPVNFWDAIEGVYAFEPDGSVTRTYVRLADGRDPRDHEMRMSLGATISLDNASHIILRNLEIGGGETGVLINGTNAQHNTVENCRIMHGT